MIRALLQSLVQQDEAILFPVQALDTVPPPSAKQKQRVGKRIQFKLLLDEPRQAIYALAQIRVAAGDVDLIPVKSFSIGAGAPPAVSAVPRHNRGKCPGWPSQYAVWRNVPLRCMIPVSAPVTPQRSRPLMAVLRFSARLSTVRVPNGNRWLS